MIRYGNIRPCPRRATALMTCALQGVTHPQPAPPERLLPFSFSDDTPDQERERTLRYSTCGRCGARFGYPDPLGHSARMYCDGCVRY